MESIVTVSCLKHIYPDTTEIHICGLDFVVNRGERVVIHGAMNNRDLYEGLSEETRRKMRHQMRVAGPGGGYVFAIGGETYVGIEQSLRTVLLMSSVNAKKTVEIPMKKE